LGRIADAFDQGSYILEVFVLIPVCVFKIFLIFSDLNVFLFVLSLERGSFLFFYNQTIGDAFMLFLQVGEVIFESQGRLNIQVLEETQFLIELCNQEQSILQLLLNTVDMLQL